MDFAKTKDNKKKFINRISIHPNELVELNFLIRCVRQGNVNS